MITAARRISKRKQNALLKCFIIDTTAAQAAGVAKVSRPCANRYFNHFREIIYMYLRRAPRFFGEIEMDQAFLGGSGRKKIQLLLKKYKKILPYYEYQMKAKEIRDRNKILMFGIAQREGPAYVHIIKRADRATLAPIVRLVVEQGSTVYTDEWRAFSELGIDGYKHESVNHSTEYINKKGNHINGIEAFWSFLKRRMGKFNGIARRTLPLHIKECEYRYNHRDDLEKALKSLLKGI